MESVLLSKMVDVGIVELSNPSYYPKVACYRRVKAWVNRRLGRSIRRPSYSYFWTNAIIADGVLEYYRTRNCAFAKNALVNYHERSRKLAGFNRPLYVDEAMNAHSFNSLRKLSEPGFDDGTVERFACFLLEKHPRTASGSLPYRPRNREDVLVDTIGMVCPFLSEYAADFNCQAAMSLAVYQIKEFLEHGISKKSGLPFHGYKSQSWDTLGGEGWGRGVGWLLMGLSSVLLHLPRQNVDYEFLLREYVSILDTVFLTQNSDGSFNELLLDGQSGRDTSATSMIAYSCAKTIEGRVVRRSYLPSCLSAYGYIETKVDSTGRVQKASGEALGASKYAGVFGWYPWGQGPSIGLGSVLERIEAG